MEDKFEIINFEEFSLIREKELNLLSQLDHPSKIYTIDAVTKEMYNNIGDNIGLIFNKIKELPGYEKSDFYYLNQEEPIFTEEKNLNKQYLTYKDFYGQKNIYLPDNDILTINDVPADVIFDYKDVFGLDISLSKTKAKLLVYYKNNIYQGCTWLLLDTENKYLGIYGIRISIENYLLKIKGSASKILNYIKEYAKNKIIVVPWPLEGMIPLLQKNDFVKIKDYDKNSEIRTFLNPYAGTSDYWILNNYK